MDGKTIQMKLFKLSRTDSPMSGDVSVVCVAAPNEKQARETANAETGVDGYVWTNGSYASCEELGTANEGVNGLLVTERA